MANGPTVGGTMRRNSTRLIAFMIAVTVVASLAFVYLFTDVFGSNLKATVQINSLGFPEDVQYEICLEGVGVSETGELLIDGTLVSDGNMVYRFEGFAAVEVVFRHTGWPDQDWVCPYSLSDGRVLQINVFPGGSVGWQLGY